MGKLQNANIKALSNTESMDTTNRKAVFKATMKNANPFTIIDGKTIMTSAEVDLDVCYVDLRYQGLRSHSKLNILERKWDPRKLTPIVLVPHPEENRFAIVDGQGRYLVAKKKGYESLQAIILMDAPQNIDERLRFEAEYFIGQDTETERVRPVEKHLARVIMGEKTARDLDKMLTKYDVKIADTAGHRKSGKLGSYSDGYNISKNGGTDCLDFIFSVIQNAGWNDETDGYSSHVMYSLSKIWNMHDDKRKEIHSYLSDSLRQMTPELLKANALSKYSKRSTRKACVLYLEDELCEAIKIERRIYDEAA